MNSYQDILVVKGGLQGLQIRYKIKVSRGQGWIGDKNLTRVENRTRLDKELLLDPQIQQGRIMGLTSFCKSFDVYFG